MSTWTSVIIVKEARQEQSNKTMFSFSDETFILTSVVTSYVSSILEITDEIEEINPSWKGWYFFLLSLDVANGAFRSSEIESYWSSLSLASLALSNISLKCLLIIPWKHSKVIDTLMVYVQIMFLLACDINIHKILQWEAWGSMVHLMSRKK